VVRPEHADALGQRDGKGDLPGTLENIVYFGTDTHFHVGSPTARFFTVRQQNRPGEAACWRPDGRPVGIAIPGHAAQVLRD
jgi:spermidine/putrescine transport system ATP-binding protein